MRLLLLAAALLAACAGKTPLDEDLDNLEIPEEAPLRAVPYVDLDRYMGRWYIVANIPYFAELGNVAPYVEYRRREDARIDDFYTARDGFAEPPFVKKGLIEVTDPMGNAYGRITFLGPLWQDYAVLYLDAEYRHTVIGHPSRDYAWLFAREPRVADADYARMLESLAANGFDPARVLKIPQFPEQLGQAGFQ
jgi:apolipoprotein D and lipocalin family protein